MALLLSDRINSWLSQSTLSWRPVLTAKRETKLCFVNIFKSWLWPSPFGLGLLGFLVTQVNLALSDLSYPIGVLVRAFHTARIQVQSDWPKQMDNSLWVVEKSSSLKLVINSPIGQQTVVFSSNQSYLYIRVNVFITSLKFRISDLMSL